MVRLCTLNRSSHLINLICTSVNIKISTKVHLKHYCTKRFLSTKMASPNEESLESKTPEKQDNLLLSKRFVGLEKNIW